MEQEEYTASTMTPPIMTTKLLLVKIGAMLILGCGSLGLGMLPIFVRRCRLRKDRTIASNSSILTTTSSNASTDSQGLLTSLLLCFGGGVLLFTAFLHLAPEVRQSVERHQLDGQLATFGGLSLADLLFCGGFFFVYLVEEAVHAALDNTSKPESSETVLYRTVSLRRCNGATAPTAGTRADSRKNERLTNNTKVPDTWYDNGGKDSSRCIDGAITGTTGHEIESTVDGRSVLTIFTLSSETCDSRNTVKDLSQVSVSDNQDGTSKRPVNSDTSAHGLLAVLALSFHAVFEGLAVGLEPSITSVVYLVAAIATHKLVIAFCVGMELLVTGAATRTILGYMMVFSMVTPLGIGVGLVLSYFNNQSDNLGPIPTILQGMAAGTLLYVVFFEVLARERANEKSGLLQLAAIAVGFMLMLGLQLATGHSHESNQDHDHESEHRNKKHEQTFDEAINRITERVADIVSSTLASTAIRSELI